MGHELAGFQGLAAFTFQQAGRAFHGSGNLLDDDSPLLLAEPNLWVGDTGCCKTTSALMACVAVTQLEDIGGFRVRPRLREMVMSGQLPQPEALFITNERPEALVRRADHLGLNTDRIWIIVCDEHGCSPEFCERVCAACAARPAITVVVFDSIYRLLHNCSDVNKETDVRNWMQATVCMVAKVAKVAVLMTDHTNKTTRTGRITVNNIKGASVKGQLATVVMAFEARHTDEPYYVRYVIKNSVGPIYPNTKEVIIYVSDFSIDVVTDVAPDSQSCLDKACSAVLEALASADNGTMSASELQAAVLSQNVSPASLRRAKEALRKPSSVRPPRIEFFQAGYGRFWRIMGDAFMYQGPAAAAAFMDAPIANAAPPAAPAPAPPAPASQPGLQPHHGHHPAPHAPPAPNRMGVHEQAPQPPVDGVPRYHGSSPGAPAQLGTHPGPFAPGPAPAGIMGAGALPPPPWYAHHAALPPQPHADGAARYPGSSPGDPEQLGVPPGQARVGLSSRWDQGLAAVRVGALRSASAYDKPPGMPPLLQQHGPGSAVGSLLPSPRDPSHVPVLWVAPQVPGGGSSGQVHAQPHARHAPAGTHPPKKQAINSMPAEGDD